MDVDVAFINSVSRELRARGVAGGRSGMMAWFLTVVDPPAWAFDKGVVVLLICCWRGPFDKGVVTGGGGGLSGG